MKNRWKHLKITNKNWEYFQKAKSLFVEKYIPEGIGNSPTDNGSIVMGIIIYWEYQMEIIKEKDIEITELKKELKKQFDEKYRDD